MFRKIFNLEKLLFLICVLKLVTVAHTPNRHVAEKVDDQE